MRRSLLVGLLAAAMIVGSAPVADADSFDELVTGRPHIDLVLSENRIEPSESGQWSITISNSGEIRKTGPATFVKRVKTARNVELTVLEDRIDAPIRIKSGARLLGAVQDGQASSATFEYETGADLQPGTYRIPVRVEYDSTWAVGYDNAESPPGYKNTEYRDTSRSEIKYVTVVVEDESRFRLTSNTTDLYVGDTGTLEVTLRNVGTETARNARLELTPNAPSFSFSRSESSSTSVFMSTLEPGESKTATVEVAAQSDISPGTYPVEARVVYDNNNGVETKSDPLTADVQARSERRFSVRHLRTEAMRAGENEAVVTAEIVNNGPSPARNAVVSLALGNARPDTRNGSGEIRVTSGEASVGDLAPGEARRVRFTLAIPEGTEPGDRTLDFDVAYENSDGDPRQYRSPMRHAVTVKQDVNTFAVTGVKTNVSIDSSNQIVLAVRNTAQVTYGNVTVQLAPQPPFTSVSPEAYVSTLAPGETARLTYELTTAEDAVPSTHGLQVTVRADEPDGDTIRSDTKRVTVTVTPQQTFEQEWFSIVIGGGVVALILGVGSFVINRR